MAEEGRDDIVEQTTNCLAEGFIVSLSGEMASACLRYPSLGPHKRGGGQEGTEETQARDHASRVAPWLLEETQLSFRYPMAPAGGLRYVVWAAGWAGVGGR